MWRVEVPHATSKQFLRWAGNVTECSVARNSSYGEMIATFRSAPNDDFTTLRRYSAFACRISTVLPQVIEYVV
jgi:hypothetical protein